MNINRKNRTIINISILGLIVYTPLAIILPIFVMNTNYALSMLILFWIPVVIMLCVNIKWMAHRNMIIPFIICNLIMALVSFYFEYAAIGINIWHFSEEHHKLLRTIFNHPGFPYAICGVPIEEFMFWFGATPFSILLYLSFLRLLDLRKKAYEFLLLAAWPLIAMPFLPLVWCLNKKISGHKILSRTSLFSVLVLFVITLTFVEHHAIINGHWVFHENRIWGPRFWSIPIEEFLYYL
jgi:lycopene cyclase domain-containing protein